MKFVIFFFLVELELKIKIGQFHAKSIFTLNSKGFRKPSPWIYKWQHLKSHKHILKEKLRYWIWSKLGKWSKLIGRRIIFLKKRWLQIMGWKFKNCRWKKWTIEKIIKWITRIKSSFRRKNWNFSFVNHQQR